MRSSIRIGADRIYSRDRLSLQPCSQGMDLLPLAQRQQISTIPLIMCSAPDRPRSRDGAGQAATLHNYSITSFGASAKQIVVWVKVDNLAHIGANIVLDFGDTSLANYYQWTISGPFSNPAAVFSG